MSLRKKPETGSEGVNKPMGKRQRMIERYKKTILDFLDKNVGKSKLGAKARKAKRKREKSERQRKQREEGYAKKVEESREGKEVVITKDKVVAGLKFIAENPDMGQDQLIDELIALGCNFSNEDIKKQFPGERLFIPMNEKWRFGLWGFSNC